MEKLAEAGTGGTGEESKGARSLTTVRQSGRWWKRTARAPERGTLHPSGLALCHRPRRPPTAFRPGKEVSSPGFCSRGNGAGDLHRDEGAVLHRDVLDGLQG